MYGNGPGTFAALILLCGLVVVARYVSPLRSSSPRVNNGLILLALAASITFLFLHFNAFARIYKMAHGSDFPVDTLAAAQHEFDFKENPYATKSQLMFDPSNAPHVTNENGQLKMFGVPYYYGYAYFPAIFMSYEPFRWLESSHRYIRIGNVVFLFVILGAVGWLTSLFVPKSSRVLGVSLSIAATVCALGLAREYFLEGATDVIIPMFTLLGFIAAYYKRPSLAGCLLGWAFACKLLPGAIFCLILGGWYWRQDARWKFWIAMVGTFAAVVVPHVLRNPPAFFSATILYYLTQHANGNDTSLYFVLPPQDVHRLGQAIVQGLLHKRMVGHFAVTGDVLQAGKLIGKNGGQQILGLHSLEGRRHFMTIALTGQSQGARCVPTPPDGEHGRVQQRLHEDFPHRFAVQVAENFIERK